MGRTLVILAHPHLSGSRINAFLADSVRDIATVDIHDLYAAYPDRKINVALEQALLVDYDEIVLQFPLHWYSVPGLLKQWLDDVLSRGWAYGTGGAGALQGKSLRVVTSTGGVADAYKRGGFHRFTMEQVLLPLDATAHRVGMSFAPPLIVHDARGISEEELSLVASAYQALLSEAPARMAS